MNVNASNSNSELECPDGYHIEARDGEGTEQCISDYNPCEDDGVHYLNIEDVCVSNRLCADSDFPKPYGCTVREKPETLEIDCKSMPDHSFCTGENGRGGSPFCDLPSHPGSCSDRNDTPENYCVNYQDGKWNFCENADICDDDKSY